MDAQELENSVEGAGQPELLVQDGDHDVSAHRDPDLGPHRVGAGAVVVFDAQVAFDPLEEEFDLPPGFVEQGHAQGGDPEVVGQEDEAAPARKRNAQKSTAFISAFI